MNIQEAIDQLQATVKADYERLAITLPPNTTMEFGVEILHGRFFGGQEKSSVRHNVHVAWEDPAGEVWPRETAHGSGESFDKALKVALTRINKETRKARELIEFRKWKAGRASPAPRPEAAHGEVK